MTFTKWQVDRGPIQLVGELMGPEDGDLVVLISGAGAPAQFWPRTFCEGLAERGFRVVRYHHRDTGHSTHLDEPYPIGELVDDLGAIIARFHDDGPVHLVGHSMGGFIAQLFACRGEFSLGSVTSISAGSATDHKLCARLEMSQPTSETWDFLMANQPKGNFGQDLEGWLGTWKFLNGAVPLDEKLATLYTRALYEGDPRNAQAATNHVHAMSTVPVQLVDDLRQLRCPFLVLHGTEDPLVPMDNGMVTAGLVDGSRFVPLRGAGHMFFHEGVWSIILDEILPHLCN
jgi:pimeloyl-ACP methyl ester carboxylesterase